MPDEQPTSGIPADDSIAWASITESLIIFAGSAAEIPGAAEVIKIIKALVGIADAQAALLRRIDRDVQLIRLGSFHSAREHLEIAGRNTENQAEREHHLREAENDLIEALGRGASDSELSIIRFNLGVVAAIRGNHQEARIRLHQAYEGSVKATSELNMRASSLSGDWDRHLAAGVVLVWTVPYVAVPIGIRGVIKLNQARQVIKELKAYVPFAEMAAHAYRTFDPAAEVLAPKLGNSGSLEWVDLKPQL